MTKLDLFIPDHQRVIFPVVLPTCTTGTFISPTYAPGRAQLPASFQSTIQPQEKEGSAARFGNRDEEEHAARFGNWDSEAPVNSGFTDPANSGITDSASVGAASDGAVQLPIGKPLSSLLPSPAWSGKSRRRRAAISTHCVSTVPLGEDVSTVPLTLCSPRRQRFHLPRMIT